MPGTSILQKRTILTRPSEARGEVAYSETNSVREPGNSTIGAVPGLDIAFTGKGRAILLTGHIPYGTALTAATTLVITLHDVTNNVELARTAHDFTAANSQALRTLSVRIPAFTGTRRYQLRSGLFSGTNAVRLQLGVSPGFIRAEEI